MRVPSPHPPETDKRLQCSPEAERTRESEKAHFQENTAGGRRPFDSLRPLKGATDQQRWRGHYQILAVHQKQDVDTEGVSMPVPELICAGRCLLTLGVSSSTVGFPGSLELIQLIWHGGLRSQSVSRTREAPVKTQAAGRSQGRAGGHLQQGWGATLSPRLKGTWPPRGAPSHSLIK